MKVVAIIQARMGSTRLPGKIMKKVLDKSLLEYQIERVKRSKLIGEIVIATTTSESEEPIVDFCKKHFISYYRGSEDDVLSRYYEAAEEYNADVVVRLTSDCPLIDPEIIDKVISIYLKRKEGIDYVSNTLERTYPRGMDTEVFSYDALKTANDNAVSPPEREHVTPYFFQNPRMFKILSVTSDTNHSEHRWTVDTLEDFVLIEKIIEALYKNKPLFSYFDILKLLDENREWFDINAEIKQKRL
ncbi:cytidylyltransferase domain-containing protein [Virgibacillus sp. W0181]|uniref:cytidylyltransferase domain-containing protein n=1 Tax=Virgibacillus sp. W0181 TaxID=3391581 RepID=UPI003F462676